MLSSNASYSYTSHLKTLREITGRASRAVRVPPLLDALNVAPALPGLPWHSAVPASDKGFAIAFAAAGKERAFLRGMKHELSQR